MLRHHKAKEDEVLRQAEAAAEAVREAVSQEAARQEATHREAIRQEAAIQEAANQTPFDFDDPTTWENCNRTITNDGMPPPRARIPDMEEIRQALIVTTGQIFRTHKTVARASTIKKRVRKQFRLDSDFFTRNGWKERADLIILRAFSDAWVSPQPSTRSRPERRRGLWTTVN